MAKQLSITIITPNLNGGKYLEDCIVSLKSQEYKNLRHIIIDGGSTDNSKNIAERYNVEFYLKLGLNNYEAIHFGFTNYRADVFGWLNSDDLLRPGALHSINEVFTNYTCINWVSGIPTISDNLGRIFIGQYFSYPPYSKYSQLLNSKNYIQQESTFWRSKIYFKVGGLSTNLIYANDYDLWRKLFDTEKLYHIPIVLASFREHSVHQISKSNKDKYENEARQSLVNSTRKYKFRNITKIFIFLDLVLIKIPVVGRLYVQTRFREKYLSFPAEIKVLEDKKFYLNT